jgi:hypothetical protein
VYVSATLKREGLPDDLFPVELLLTGISPVFHLTHCATQCAAPKLWSILK